MTTSTNPSIRPELAVADVMARFPATQVVFARFRVDACCGGAHSIAQTAHVLGVELAPLLDALNAAVTPADTNS